jgi:hypothetical protein
MTDWPLVNVYLNVAEIVLLMGLTLLCWLSTRKDRK